MSKEQVFIRNNRASLVTLPAMTVGGASAPSLTLMPGDTAADLDDYKVWIKNPTVKSWFELGMLKKVTSVRATPKPAPVSEAERAALVKGSKKKDDASVEITEDVVAPGPQPVKFEEPAFEEVKAEPEPPASPVLVVLGELSAREAKKLIKRTNDLDVLEGWLSAEERTTVRKAINEQVKSINEG